MPRSAAGRGLRAAVEGALARRRAAAASRHKGGRPSQTTLPPPPACSALAVWASLSRPRPSGYMSATTA